MKKIIILLMLVIFISGCIIQKEAPKPIDDEEPFEEIIGEWKLIKNQANAWSCTQEERIEEIFIKGFPTEKECVDYCLSISTPTREGDDCEQRDRKIKCIEEGDIFLKGIGGCISKEDDDKCIGGGGLGIRWFADGCVDSCGRKPRICTLALELGCDCGPSKCWDECPKVGDITVCGIPKCIDDPYEPYATEQEACEATNGKWIGPLEGQKFGCDEITGLCIDPPRCWFEDYIITEDPLEIEQLHEGGFSNYVTNCCICPEEGQLFTPFKGCIPKDEAIGLLSMIAYR